MMMQQMMTYQAPPWADNQPLVRSKTACSGRSKTQSMQSSHGFIHLLNKLSGIVVCLFARTHMQIVKFMHLPQTNKRFIESSSCSSRHEWIVFCRNNSSNYWWERGCPLPWDPRTVPNCSCFQSVVLSCVFTLLYSSTLTCKYTTPPYHDVATL